MIPRIKIIEKEEDGVLEVREEDLLPQKYFREIEKLIGIRLGGKLAGRGIFAPPPEPGYEWRLVTDAVNSTILTQVKVR
jgi:hypothetical protein